MRGNKQKPRAEAAARDLERQEPLDFGVSSCLPSLQSDTPALECCWVSVDPWEPGRLVTELRIL